MNLGGETLLGGDVYVLDHKWLSLKKKSLKASEGAACFDLMFLGVSGLIWVNLG